MPLRIQTLSPFTGTRVIPAAGVLLPPRTRHSSAPKGHFTAAQGNALGFNTSMIPEPCKDGPIRAAFSSTLGAGDPMDVETGESLRGVTSGRAGGWVAFSRLSRGLPRALPWAAAEFP